MDDNNKKNGEGLDEELSGLANLFQEELDKANADAEKISDDELIEHIPDWEGVLPVDEVETEAEEEPLYRQDTSAEEDMCECCGERPKNKSIGENYPYCSECREAMKRYPIKWPIAFLITIIAVLVVFSGVSFFTTTRPNFAAVSYIDKLIAQKKLETAQVAAYTFRTNAEDFYSNYTENASNPTKATISVAAYKYIIQQEIKLYFSRGLDYVVTPDSSSNQSMSAFNYSMYLIKQYFPLNDLDLVGNGDIKKLNQKFELIALTINDAESAMAESEENYEAICAKIDELAADKETKYDKAILEFLKYYAAFEYGQSEDVQIEHLLKVKKINPSYYWFYEEPLFQAYFSSGKYDDALSVCKSSQQRNVENATAYAMEASVYRIQKNYEDAAESCNAGIAIDETNDECYRQLAIVRLLEGDNKSAYTAAKVAYEHASSLASFNVFAICCHLQNDTEAYNEIIETLDSYQQNYTLSSSVTDFVAGKITLENIFLEGTGDVV